MMIAVSRVLGLPEIGQELELIFELQAHCLELMLLFSWTEESCYSLQLTSCIMHVQL